MKGQFHTGMLVLATALLVVSNVYAKDDLKQPIGSYQFNTADTEDGWKYHGFSAAPKELMVLRYKEADGQLTAIRIEIYPSKKSTTSSQPELTIDTTDVVGASVKDFGYYGKAVVVLYQWSETYHEAISYKIKKDSLIKNGNYQYSGNVQISLSVQKKNVYLITDMSVTLLDVNLKRKSYYVSFFSNGTNSMLGGALKDTYWLNVMTWPDDDDVMVVDVYKL